MGLATEKACTWLSANITGKVQARGVADQVFQKWTGMKLEDTWGRRDSEPAGNSEGCAWVCVVSPCRAALVTSFLFSL